jgi:hypothetical protein
MLTMNLAPVDYLDIAAVTREHALPASWAEYHLERAAAICGGSYRGPASIRRAEWSKYLRRFGRGLPRHDEPLPPRPRSHNFGQRVYFAQGSPADRIKIGVSGDVARRLRGLQAENPGRVEILLTIDGDRATEKWLHERFGHLRLHNEWFRFADELEVYLDMIANESSLSPYVPSRGGLIR